MSGPTTPAPARFEVDLDERATLLAFLDYYRTVFVRKAEGFTDDEARRATCPPSEMTVMGLVRHMAEVERGWFRRSVAAEDAPAIYYSDAPGGDPDGDFHPGPDDTLEDALAVWHDEVDRARTILADVSLDQTFAHRRLGAPKVRWVIVHMVEEYARHVGHLDLLTEALDGRTGD
ncbi:DinB family protein [soil metagenome]